MRILSFGFILVASAALIAPAANAADAPADGNKLVCRSIRVTGTRFPTRICHKKADWDRMREQQRRDAEELLNSRVVETRRS